MSYLAIAQWVAASTNPPHLKAIIPWQGQSDNYREVLIHGGIPETAFTGFWLNRMRSLAHSSPLPPDFVMRFAQRRPLLMKRLQEHLQPPSGIRLEQIRVPALICASWSDQGLHRRGSFEAYKRIASEQKWLLTPGRAKWDTYYDDTLEGRAGFDIRFDDTTELTGNMKLRLWVSTDEGDDMDLFEHPMLAYEHSVNRGRHSIHSGGRYDSHLLVPVIPRAGRQ